MITTVACVFVRGHVTAYTPLYVIRLAAMVRRWMDRPYRFICLTDRPAAIPASLETIRIPSPGTLKGWWSKLELFNPRNALGGRVLYLDLDSLIVGALGPIVDYPAPFALVPHAGTFNGKDGLRVVKRFNSSVMVWDAGTLAALYLEWSPAVATDLHGDQDWIGEQSPDAALLPAAWFPRLSEIADRGLPIGARVVLAKRPKNAEAARRYPWFRERWV